MRTRAIILFAVVVAIVAASGAIAAAIFTNIDLPEARSFSLDAIDVDARLTPEGMLEVTEQVTYTFRGADQQPFTVGSRDFDGRPEGGTITSIAAYDEDGAPLPTLLSSPTLFEWGLMSATSGTYTYEVRYTVEGAVAIGSDVVELNRQWIGSSSPAVGQWSAEVHVPRGAGELLAWAHGPLDGTLDVGDASVAASVSDVPAATFVETRLAIPVERFAFDPAEVALQPELLPDILAEEQVWADEANAARAAAQEREDLRATIERTLNLLCIPLALLALWTFWMIWRKWGRDPKRPDDIGDYWRDVPDDPPAVADAFLSWRQVGGAGYAATILDLARRDQFRIEEVPVERFLRSDAVEHRFVRAENPPTVPLRRFERRAVTWLFKDGPTITKSELVERSKKDPTAAQRFWKGFRKETLAELDEKQYVVHDRIVPIGLHVLIIVALVGLVVLALATNAWLAAVVLGGMAIALIPLTVLHLQRTPAGARRHAEWTALRNYLRDFSRLDEAPVGHLALWEQYLVASVALGVSEELMRGLEVHYPDMVEGRGGVGFAPWYVAAHHGQIGEIGSFGSSFGTAAVSSFTPQSSGSGGGGGFSGGGGGGGGGGGFGAR